MLNKDYRDILLALAAEKAEFLLVGAYAMAVHGYPRATMDIDIWVKPSCDNARAVLRALKRFGAPLHDLTEADLQKDDTIFQIGVAPRRIDLITGATGLRFDEALACYDQALQLQPDYADAYRNRALAYRDKGSKPQAITDVEKYLQLAPNAADRAQVEQWLAELKAQ
jgi:regulator of sirC expression with transglutaminase-like and TPR domain